MKTVVITGSTRGLGYGLAEAFLGLGCEVVVSGRKEESVEKAATTLGEKFGGERVLGVACDVGDHSQVEGLWARAVERFGKVDIWINNAGIGQGMMKFWEIKPDQMKAIVETNLTGTMYGARAAIGGMMEQGYGAVYNMEGSGSDGRVRHGLTVYGSSKRGGRFLTEALVKEVEGTGVMVGALSPGMLVTELVTGEMDRDAENQESVRRILNIIGDRVETVAPWLAERVLTNEKNGARIRWLTGGKAMWRFLTAPFVKRDLFGDG